MNNTTTNKTTSYVFMFIQEWYWVDRYSSNTIKSKKKKREVSELFPSPLCMFHIPSSWPPNNQLSFQHWEVTLPPATPPATPPTNRTTNVCTSTLKPSPRLHGMLKDLWGRERSELKVQSPLLTLWPVCYSGVSFWVGGVAPHLRLALLCEYYDSHMVMTTYNVRITIIQQYILLNTLELEDNNSTAYCAWKQLLEREKNWGKINQEFEPWTSHKQGSISQLTTAKQHNYVH